MLCVDTSRLASGPHVPRWSICPGSVRRVLAVQRRRGLAVLDHRGDRALGARLSTCWPVRGATVIPIIAEKAASFSRDIGLPWSQLRRIGEDVRCSTRFPLTHYTSSALRC